jgi:hypothetical protein
MDDPDGARGSQQRNRRARSLITLEAKPEFCEWSVTPEYQNEIHSGPPGNQWPYLTSMIHSSGTGDRSTGQVPTGPAGHEADQRPQGRSSLEPALIVRFRQRLEKAGASQKEAAIGDAPQSERKRWQSKSIRGS